MKPNRLVSASWCYDLPVSCGAYAVRRRWKLDYLKIQAEHLRDRRQTRQLYPNSRDVNHVVLGSTDNHDVQFFAPDRAIASLSDGIRADNPSLEFARCFLRLANLPNFALDRLSRYEGSLSRQAGRILFALHRLDRRKPQERSRGIRRLCLGR